MSKSTDPVLQTIMELSGVKFSVTRNSQVITEVDGLKNCDPYSGRNYIALFPDVDVAAGDLLVAEKSQEEFFIIATEPEYVDGLRFQDRAYYGSQEEYATSQLPSSPSEPAAENDQSDLITDYLDYLYSLIRIKTPGSQQEFAALLLQVEEILSGNEITKGSLADYSQLLDENEWLGKAIGTILVSWISR